MRNNLKGELLKRFGIDGDGILQSVEWLGRENNGISVKEFELWSGAKLEDGQANEFGSEDFNVTLIDEDDEDLHLTLEVKDNVITHSYFK